MQLPSLSKTISDMALAVFCLVALASQAVSGAAPARDSAPVSSRSILAAAFANRYEINWVSRIELVMRNQTGQERRRLFHAASKVIDDRVHAVGRLVWPEHLRGMTILTIENRDRSHDAFVYLPSLEKVRRVTTAQRGDSFLGTDVTYEDLERRRIDEYELARFTEEEFEGERVFRIRARSLRGFNYSDVVFVIAQADSAILETRYFKQGAEEAFRLVRSPRDSMIERAGHTLPTRFAVHDRTRGTWTDVLLTNLMVNPAIDDHLFSLTTLETQRELPDPSRLPGLDERAP